MTAKEKLSIAKYYEDKEARQKAVRNELKASDNKEEEKKMEEPVPEKKKPEKNIQEILEEELKIPKSEYLKGDLISDLTPRQADAYKQYQAIYKSFHKDIFRWFKFFYPDDKDFNTDNYDSLEKIGINSAAKFLALFVQNQVHAKNADRKSAFTTGRHKDVWKEEEAVAFLERSYRRLVLTRLKKQSKKKNNADSIASSSIEFFAYTDSLEEAAGILMNGFDLAGYQYLMHLIRIRGEMC